MTNVSGRTVITGSVFNEIFVNGASHDRILTLPTKETPLIITIQDTSSNQTTNHRVLFTTNPFPDSMRDLRFRGKLLKSSCSAPFPTNVEYYVLYTFRSEPTRLHIECSYNGHYKYESYIQIE